MKKVMIVLGMGLVFFGILTGCRKKEGEGVKTYVEKVIARWESQVKRERDELDDLIRKTLRTANATSSQYSYAFAGQIQTVHGDVRGALKTLKKAIAVNPRSAEPHYILAQLYYKLAIFDMVDRGLYSTEMIPLDELPFQALKDGHLKLELRELIISRCPAYKSFLKKCGINGEERNKIMFYILWLDKEKIAGDKASEDLDNEIKERGLPKKLPVPIFNPDKPSKELLKNAYKQIQLGEKGSTMEGVPPRIEIVNLVTIRALKARICSLLPGEVPSIPTIPGGAEKDLQVPPIVMELIEDKEGQDELLADIILKFQETPDPTMWQMVMAAQFHQAAGQQKKALNLYLQAVEKYPWDGEPLIGIGEICYEAAMKYMVANDEFEQAETGLVVMRPGDKAKDILMHAKSYFERANKLRFSVKEEKDGAKIYLFSPEKAEENLRVIDSNLMNYWSSKASEAEKAGQHESALKYYEEALIIDLNNFVANQGKGNTLFMLLRFKEALESFEKALSIRPKAFEALNNRELTKLCIYGIPCPTTKKEAFKEKTIEFLKKEVQSSERKDRLGAITLLYVASENGDLGAKAVLEAVKKENPDLLSEFIELELPKY